MQVDLVKQRRATAYGSTACCKCRVASTWPVDGVCCVHGTGGNFYGSTLFDALAERCLHRGSPSSRQYARA